MQVNERSKCEYLRRRQHVQNEIIPGGFIRCVQTISNVLKKSDRIIAYWHWIRYVRNQKLGRLLVNKTLHNVLKNHERLKMAGWNEMKWFLFARICAPLAQACSCTLDWGCGKLILNVLWLAEWVNEMVLRCPVKSCVIDWSNLWGAFLYLCSGPAELRVNFVLVQLFWDVCSSMVQATA